MHRFSELNIGVLALQGDFERHLHQLGLVGAKAREVKLPADFEGLDGLIIPGGESTTMHKMIECFDLRPSLMEFGRLRPVWGTCAGMIMLSKRIEDNQAGVVPLGLIDIDVVRTGYGRQVYSFDEPLEASLKGHRVTLQATFIRAPRITRVGAEVGTLAEYAGEPVLVCEGGTLASSFHTELDDDTTLLSFFLKEFVIACRPADRI